MRVKEVEMAQMAHDEAMPAEPLVTEDSIQEARRKVMELAERQGVKPIRSLKDLKGDFWPEDESIDEFIATIRQWRRESDRHAP
jgi:hypothetical protein